MAGRITEVLEELRRGAPGAREELLQLVNDELHRLAKAQMKGQPRDHTLQPTALVNEAYLRLLGDHESAWENRAHFFRTAARAMRSILVDFARARGALKRGGGSARVTFDEALHGDQDGTYEVIAVHEALEKLEAVDPQMSQVVELRFFCGLSVVETARVLGIAERTVYLVWEHARAWLYREMQP